VLAAPIKSRQAHRDGLVYLNRRPVVTPTVPIFEGIKSGCVQAEDGIESEYCKKGCRHIRSWAFSNQNLFRVWRMKKKSQPLVTGSIPPASDCCQRRQGANRRPVGPVPPGDLIQHFDFCWDVVRRRTRRQRVMEGRNWAKANGMRASLAGEVLRARLRAIQDWPSPGCREAPSIARHQHALLDEISLVSALCPKGPVLKSTINQRGQDC